MQPGSIGGPGLPGRTRITEATMTSDAIIERDSLGRFVREIERNGTQMMEQLAGRLEDRAQRYAPMRTGRLRRSIKAVVLMNGREIRITTNVPYAWVMEEGSRPHLIHGVRANFDWKGGRFVWNDPKWGPVGVGEGYKNWTGQFGATVQHPGTRGYWFFRRAFKETMSEAKTVMAHAYPRR